MASDSEFFRKTRFYFLLRFFQSDAERETFVLINHKAIVTTGYFVVAINQIYTSSPAFSYMRTRLVKAILLWDLYRRK